LKNKWLNNGEEQAEKLTTRLFKILKNSRYTSDVKPRVLSTNPNNRFEALLVTGHLGLLSDSISKYFRNVKIVFQIQFYLRCRSILMILHGDLSHLSHVTRGNQNSY